MGTYAQRRGLTLVEVLISLSAVSVLLAVLIPALSSARVSSRRVLCAGNQRLLGQGWNRYLDTHDGAFPVLYAQPAWRYGGVRFSTVDGSPFLDFTRPLNRFLPVLRPDASAEELYRCPADHGITDETSGIGTGRRTAFRAFGTSYRANTELVDGARPLRRQDVTTAHSRLVVMGDPVWFEVHEDTGRLAAWHGPRNAGNLLFLDGSVRFMTIEPKPVVGPAVFDPVSPEFAFPRGRNGGDG